MEWLQPWPRSVGWGEKGGYVSLFLASCMLLFARAHGGVKGLGCISEVKTDREAWDGLRRLRELLVRNGYPTAEEPSNSPSICRQECRLGPRAERIGRGSASPSATCLMALRRASLSRSSP